jgi:PAS domain S-box-containing protein
LSHKLLTSPQALAKILDLAEDAIISVDDRQRIVLFNSGAERVFGYSAQEVKGQPLDMLIPARFAAAHRAYLRDFSKSPAPSRRMSERSRIYGRRKDGTEFPAEASISRVGLNGATTYTAILRDVTDRAAVEEKIMESLREKEVLLKEIHHRVKNNLQVVESLLGLQARGSSEEITRRMLMESQNRVHTMALLHETLYQSENLSQIEFHDYIRHLADHLFQSYRVSSKRIRLDTALDELHMNMDAAVPCGLILNELLSNALKHAFPENGEGVIRIELRDLSNHTVRLVVADDGVGFASESDWKNPKTLGLRLVRTLADQLGGEIAVKPNPGAEVQLTFSTAAIK